MNLKDYEHLIGQEIWAWDDDSSTQIRGVLTHIYYEPALYPFRLHVGGGDYMWFKHIEPIKSIEPIEEPKPTSRVVAYNDATSNRYSGTYIGRSFTGEHVVTLDDKTISMYKYIEAKKQITVADAEVLIKSLTGKEVEIV